MKGGKMTKRITQVRFVTLQQSQYLQTRVNDAIAGLYNSIPSCEIVGVQFQSDRGIYIVMITYTEEVTTM